MRIPLVVMMLAACAGGPPAQQPSKAQGSPGVFTRACAAQCSGPLAKLTVWRNAEEAIGVVMVQGGPEDCSNPPLLFFGPDGVQRAGIPMEPVIRGSPEAKQYADIRTAQTAGLHEAETMLCREIKR